MEFHSARQTPLVIVNLPLALVGGVLNIATPVGFITFFASPWQRHPHDSHYNYLLAEGTSLRDAEWRGSMERLSPMFMTALAAGLALLPLATAGGEPGNEIQSPLARVVLCGLLTALALNMVVVPVLFLHCGVAGQREEAGG